MNGGSTLNGASTINSTFNVSGATLLRSDLTVSGTATLNNLTVNGTISGTNFNKTLVGLSNVANTAPSDLPVSTATQSALNAKMTIPPNGALYIQNNTLTMLHNNAFQLGFGTTSNVQLYMTLDQNTGFNFYENGSSTFKFNVNTDAVLYYNATVMSKLDVSGDIVARNAITTNTLFIRGAGGSYINSDTQLFINGGTNGVTFFSGSNQIATFNTGGTSFLNSTKVLQSRTSDNALIVQNILSGQSSLHLYSNTTVGSRIYQDPLGSLNIAVNISGSTSIPLSLYSNGVCQIGGNAVNNKMLVLYEQGASDTPSSAINFFGLGISSNTLRYQVPVLSNTHRFFCGSTSSYFITNGAGTSGSDYRWKSEVQNITNGLDKVKQLQGKTFKYQNCIGRQMGMIAQEVKPVIPEIVYEDDDGYMFLAYDRLVALLIESIKELEQRVATLENNI